MHPTNHHDNGGSETPDSKTGRLGIGGWLVIGILLAILGAAIWFAVDVWLATDGVQISVNGKIAMALGIVVTTAVGAGLMALVFWSSRNGYDR